MHPWIWTLTILVFLQGAASTPFTNYLKSVNKNRQKAFTHYNVSGSNLVEDSRLAKKAAGLSCNFKPPKGNRIFWIPKGSKSSKYWDRKVSKFLERALTDVEAALRGLGNFPGHVDNLSLGQTKVGCAWKSCILISGGVKYEHSGICVLGSKSTLKAADVPFHF